MQMMESKVAGFRTATIWIGDQEGEGGSDSWGLVASVSSSLCLHRGLQGGLVPELLGHRVDSEMWLIHFCLVHIYSWWMSLSGLLCSWHSLG